MIDETVSYLSTSTLDGAQALMSLIVTHMAQGVKGYDNPLYVLFDAGMTKAMTDIDVAANTKTFMAKFAEEGGKNYEYFRDFWQNMTLAEKEAFVEAYGLSKNFIANMTRGMTNDQIMGEFQKASRTAILSSAVQDESKYLSGLKGAYEEAAEGGADYLATIDSMAEEVYALQQAERDLAAYRNNKNDAGARQRLEEYFGVSDITKYTTDTLAHTLEMQKAQVTNTMENIKQTIGELTGDSDVVLGDILNAALNGDDTLKYLAQLYLRLKFVGDGADQARMGLTEMVDAISSGKASDADKLALLQSYLVDDNALQMIINQWEEVGGTISSILGDQISEAIESGTSLSLDQVRTMMDQQMNYLTLKSA